MNKEQLQTLSREDLDHLQQDVLAEQSRRDTLDTTVSTVQQLGVKYEELGGDRAELVAALQAEPSTEGQ